jgi:hypothetical protein
MVKKYLYQSSLSLNKMADKPAMPTQPYERLFWWAIVVIVVLLIILMYSCKIT